MFGWFFFKRAADDTILSEDDEAEAAIAAVVHGNPPMPSTVKSHVSISNEPLGTETAHDVTAITCNAASSVAKHISAKETLHDDDRDDDDDDESSWDSEVRSVFCFYFNAIRIQY